MRKSLLTTLLFVPLVAAGQVVPVGSDTSPARLLAAPIEGDGGQTAVPLWRSQDGRALSATSDDRVNPSSTLAVSPVQSGPFLSSGLQYDLGPRVSAHANVSGQGWINSAESCGTPAAAARSDGRCSSPGAPPRIVGSEVGATFNGSGYSVGIGLGSARPSSANVALPRVVSGLNTASGLPFSALSSSTELNAHGRLELGGRSGIDLGASVGRVRLTPGNLLGVGAVDQKSLSLGVDRGPLYGAITGRTMQPEAGAVNALNGDRRWNAIDLGVTFRLPWRGELSVGAQNVWSSGSGEAPSGPNLREPDQSRTPYVQYHQDL
ncbi:hypothetical protein [Luteibacter aegosomatissinici]|uniref:hypothetical protein n=1 Tax=Luteibacter aegosomatissinici TaxID=2911539 RepID=UPI001FF9AE5C|nr:hypothetical protein [Luteibacter aegosomatissinici]UPG95383.1 hypothetical protein L2Y97_04525 [Luteibacter aegosomatissinici]